ncbi:MAG: pyridoxal-phosphate dependent enzyme [Planctomycetota bacterium]|nr:pyridoxal-phosphate dependent enzyme [Planctomycetota bacterium]
MIDVEYDLGSVRLHESDNPYIRYFDLLPLESSEHLLPAQHGVTPTRHAERLGRKLGLPRLYLKDETVLPTRTTKDRMAAVVLSCFREYGVREFSAASTGNSSTALGQLVRFYPQCRLHLFCAEDFLDRLQVDEDEQITIWAMRGASFVEASQAAATFAQRTGIVSEGGFFNLARREGLKLAFLEAAEAVPGAIDWYVQAVSSAMGVYGVYKGANELLSLGRIAKIPRLLCVQQDTCCPMAKAFQAGSDTIRPQDIFPRPTGIAQAILRGDPSRVYPYVRRIVKENGGTIVAVDQARIVAARQMVRQLEGIDICYTSATAVAGLIAQVEQELVPRQDTVLVTLTGADRPPKPPRTVHWLERTSRGWQPPEMSQENQCRQWERAK